MAEGKAKLAPLERVREIAKKPVVRAVAAGTIIGGVVGGIAPLPPGPAATEAQEPSRPTATLSSPTLAERVVVPSPNGGKVEVTFPPTASPTPTPEPTRAPSMGATAPREKPPAKIEFFNQAGELSYNSFFYFQRETKPAEREAVVKEILNKDSTVLIDRSDVWVDQPSKDKEFFVIGPDGKTYAYLNLGDGSPILVSPEEYLKFLNNGWVGGHSGRKEIGSSYSSFWLMKGTKLQVELVDLPRPNGKTEPAFIFKSITVPEVDPNRPTDFITKEGDISFEKFFNAKNTRSSILKEMLGEMAGQGVSILFDAKDISVFSPRDSQQLDPDGKPYKKTFINGKNFSINLLLTSDQAETLEKTGWNLESRYVYPASGSDPGFWTEKVPVGTKIKAKIEKNPDGKGIEFSFQGITVPENPKTN